MRRVYAIFRTLTLRLTKADPNKQKDCALHRPIKLEVQATAALSNGRKQPSGEAQFVRNADIPYLCSMGKACGNAQVQGRKTILHIQGKLKPVKA
jgi:hypothetical protein